MVDQDEDGVECTAYVDTCVIAEGVNLDKSLHVVNVDFAKVEAEGFDCPAWFNFGLVVKRSQDADEDFIHVGSDSSC